MDDISQYEHALATARAAGDRTGEAEALEWLGNIYDNQGDYYQAITFYSNPKLVVNFSMSCLAFGSV